jgi:copper chaperone CopZ
MQTVALNLSGMSPADAALLEQAMTALAGVASVTMSLEAGKALLTYDPALCGIPQIESALAKAGFGTGDEGGSCGGGSGGCCGGCGGDKRAA